MASTFATPLVHDDGKHHLLLCASGSVATIKIPNITSALSDYPNLSIRLILTASASHFLSGQSHEQPTLSSLFAMKHVDGIYQDAHEWTKPWVRGDKILHIELRRWADLMVVAPLSANSMAKMVQGMSDNLLLSTIRAWDTTGELDAARSVTDYEAGPPLEGVSYGSNGKRKKVIVVAPAMNTAMWMHPVTAQHVKVLEEDWGVKMGGWVEVLRPVEKELACGDTGSGAMKEWKQIVGVIEERLRLRG